MHNEPFLEKLADKDGDFLSNVANNQGNIPGAEMYLNHETRTGFELKPELPESSVKRSSVEPANRNSGVQNYKNRTLASNSLLRTLWKEPIKTSVKRDILDNIRLKRLTKTKFLKHHSVK